MNKTRYALVLSLVAVVILVGMTSAILCLRKHHERQRAQQAFTKLQSFLDSGMIIGDPGDVQNTVNALLQNSYGREFLIQFDKSCETFAFDSKEGGAVFICNLTKASSHGQKLVGEFGEKGWCAGMPTQIYLNSVQIQSGKAVIGFTTSESAEDADEIEKSFGLRPGSSYEVAINISDLMKSKVDLIDVWKHGKPQSQ